MLLSKCYWQMNAVSIDVRQQWQKQRVPETKGAVTKLRRVNAFVTRDIAHKFAVVTPSGAIPAPVSGPLTISLFLWTIVGFFLVQHHRRFGRFLARRNCLPRAEHQAEHHQ
jgi:hypothetical protein